MKAVDRVCKQPELTLGHPDPAGELMGRPVGDEDEGSSAGYAHLRNGPGHPPCERLGDALHVGEFCVLRLATARTGVLYRYTMGGGTK